ncbi:hypothetical protein [Actinomadura chibensis]|uniref:Uncharacterized protein n=1 Tax=Actinomadura chibensis TaxID=392828 RepID=A0A5D0NA30_9ACTN|nr:hypothetical protein [Actinomadura chibensis]TYB41171.1 hypothetical protein FXF69_37320 [Actinomadura chibensis]
MADSTAAGPAERTVPGPCGRARQCLRHWIVARTLGALFTVTAAGVLAALLAGYLPRRRRGTRRLRRHRPWHRAPGPGEPAP